MFGGPLDISSISVATQRVLCCRCARLYNTFWLEPRRLAGAAWQRCHIALLHTAALSANCLLCHCLAEPADVPCLGARAKRHAHRHPILLMAICAAWLLRASVSVVLPVRRARPPREVGLDPAASKAAWRRFAVEIEMLRFRSATSFSARRWQCPRRDADAVRATTSGTGHCGFVSVFWHKRAIFASWAMSP